MYETGAAAPAVDTIAVGRHFDVANLPPRGGGVRDQGVNRNLERTLVGCRWLLDDEGTRCRVATPALGEGPLATHEHCRSVAPHIAQEDRFADQVAEGGALQVEPVEERPIGSFRLPARIVVRCQRLADKRDVVRAPAAESTRNDGVGVREQRLTSEAIVVASDACGQCRQQILRRRLVVVLAVSPAAESEQVPR